MADKLVYSIKQIYDYEKIKILSKNGTNLIIVGSGDKEIFEDMVEEVDRSLDNFNNDVLNSMDWVYQNFFSRMSSYGHDILKKVNNTKFFVLKWNKNKWIGNYYRNGGVESLSETDNYAIGVGIFSIKPHLNIDTTDMKLDDVKKFGFHLLKYTSINMDNRVGDPEVYGCDYVILDNQNVNNDNFSKRPDLITIERMLYRFDWNG